jgi:prolyl-tRNA editing enzyme YbaK/EbsC (Cys-tRNA(Pro) deacylase)
MDATHIAAYLREHGIAGEVIFLPEHVPTVEAAARAVDASVERIVKSVLFLAESSPVLVIAPTGGSAWTTSAWPTPSASHASD